MKLAKQRWKRTAGVAFVFALIALMVVPHVALGQVSSAGFPPQSFQRSMIFIDGTNLFYRFESMKLCISSFYELFRQLVGGRSNPQITRMYWYTIPEKYERVLRVHGSACLDRMRVVFGTELPNVKDPKAEPKEKGVDALLVADLIYHAAAKNCDYARLVSVDTDFAYAIQRVEDFGCRSAVMAFDSDAPERLRTACDDYRLITRGELLKLSSVVRTRS